VLCFDVFKPSKLIGIKSTMKVKYWKVTCI
jgi:hypothetical protein